MPEFRGRRRGGGLRRSSPACSRFPDSPPPRMSRRSRRPTASKTRPRLPRGPLSDLRQFRLARLHSARLALARRRRPSRRARPRQDARRSRPARSGRPSSPATSCSRSGLTDKGVKDASVFSRLSKPSPQRLRPWWLAQGDGSNAEFDQPGFTLGEFLNPLVAQIGPIPTRSWNGFSEPRSNQLSCSSRNRRCKYRILD